MESLTEGEPAFGKINRVVVLHSDPDRLHLEGTY